VAKEQKAKLPSRKINNALFLSDFIDVNRWWGHQLEQKPHEYSLLSRVAARYLNKPPANGLQERVFGIAKFIDTPLRRKLGSDRFEMLSLLKFNANLIRSQLEKNVTSESELVVVAEVANFLDLDLDPGSDDDCASAGVDREDNEMVGLTSVLNEMRTSRDKPNHQLGKRKK
jgi:hypothetical protein